ncbi:MAG TPA: helix-turn-helix transcriptional regulator [Thermoanaerobaculia bacterium]|nr:helix-turn-helix transcriptional regulator [Thermoanaerobaculia bacterium]
MSADPFDGLGPALRELRAERGWTQVELAERAGVSKSMLSLYERGKQRPHLDTLGKLVNALGVSLGQLAARLERRALRDQALGAGDADMPRGGHQLASLLDGVQGAAEDAGEPELAAGLSHLRVLHAVGWAAHGVVALGRLVENVREALGRVEPGGEP